jgi:hypothetical protein
MAFTRFGYGNAMSRFAPSTVISSAAERACGNQA